MTEKTEKVFYPQYKRAWAECPPFTKIFVAPSEWGLAAAIYLDENSDLVKYGHAEQGLYVTCDHHQKDLLEFEKV